MKYRLEHKLVHRAIKSGLLKRPSRCEKCKKIGKIFAHHPDYSKPLKVIWLCGKCHSEIHHMTKADIVKIKRNIERKFVKDRNKEFNRICKTYEIEIRKLGRQLLALKERIMPVNYILDHIKAEPGKKAENNLCQRTKKTTAARITP